MNRSQRRGNRGIENTQKKRLALPTGGRRLMLKRREAREKAATALVDGSTEEMSEYLKDRFSEIIKPDGVTTITKDEFGNVNGFRWKKDTVEDPAPIPRRKSRVIERGYVRDHKIVDLAKKRAEYLCEVRGCVSELFNTSSGHPYLEVHHLIMMSEGGADTMENVACVCANHHRELHYGLEKQGLKRRLQNLRRDEL